MRVGGNTSRLVRALVPVASLAATEPAKDTIRLSISTNVPDSGRADPRVSAGKTKQHRNTLARGVGGAPGAAPRGRAPGGAAQRATGLAKPWRAPADGVRPHHAEDGASAREGIELLGLSPQQAAAENAPAAPELHRHEIVVGGREMRAGKTHQHAAVFEPAHEAI